MSRLCFFILLLFLVTVPLYGATIYRNSWGVGCFFYSGGIIPMGNLHNYFSPAVPFMVEINANYRGLCLFFGYGPGYGGKVREELFYRVLWQKSDPIYYALGDLVLGYNIWNKNNFSIIPFLGIGGAGIRAYKKDSAYYDDVENLTSFVPILYGIHFDIPVMKWDDSNQEQRASYIGYFIIRISLGFSHERYAEKVTGLDGGLLFLKLGSGSQMQMILKRKKQRRN